MDENDKIRARIQILLEKKGLRVADVAREAKVSHSGLREFLIGKNQSISISYLSKICAVLGISIAELMADDDPAPPTRIDSGEAEEMVLLMQELTADERKKLLDMGKAFKYGFRENKKAS